MKKILVVDDREEVRELVAATLVVGDYRVFKADTGERALEIVRREKPDLVMMDLMMPGTVDGLAATKSIKQDPETKGCIVIVLTARNKDKDREMALEAGADDYFVKPFSPLQLIGRVEELLGA